MDIILTMMQAWQLSWVSTVYVVISKKGRRSHSQWKHDLICPDYQIKDSNLITHFRLPFLLHSWHFSCSQQYQNTDCILFSDYVSTFWRLLSEKRVTTRNTAWKASSTMSMLAACLSVCPHYCCSLDISLRYSNGSLRFCWPCSAQVEVMAK